MENAVLQRVSEFMKSENFSVNSLAKAISMPQTTLNNYILGNRKCSFELINSLLLAFPTLSAEWLLRGTGDMLITQTSGLPADTIVVNKDALIESLNSRIAEQANYIADLRYMLHLDK